MDRAAERKTVDQIGSGVPAFYGDSQVSFAVFGSVARGTARSDADIDLLIVARGLPDGGRARIEQFLALEDRLREHHPEYLALLLSPVIKTAEELKAGSPCFGT